MQSDPKGRWLVVGNISRNIMAGPGALEYKSGTRLFRGGARVYVLGYYRGGSDGVVVVGQHKKNRSFLKCVIAPHYLTNLREKVIYHPKVNEIREAASDSGVFFISNKDEALEVKSYLNEVFVRENARRIQHKILMQNREN